MLCARPFFFGEGVDERAWSHVEEVVAAGDADRYVATFFAPRELRRGLLALYAFDHEVSRISLTVREPMAGHIRLAWWREQVAAVYGRGVLQAPVPQALAEVVRTHDLPRGLFESYLDARALDLEEAPFADEAAMERHARAVGGGVLQLAVRVLGAGERADAAALQAGVAVATARHVRDAAVFARWRRCRLPVQWLSEAGMNTEDVFAAQEGAAASLHQVFGRMQARVRSSLKALNASSFPRVATPALAVATLAREVHDPFRRQAHAAWRRLARLALANLTWRF